MPIAGLRDVGYRSPRVDLQRRAAGAVTGRRRDAMGCESRAGGGRIATMVFCASGASRPQRRMPIVGPRVHSVGYRSPGCATSDNDRFACIDRLSWYCLHVGDVDLDRGLVSSRLCCLSFDFFPLGRLDRGCRSLLFSSLSPSDASLISERSELAPLDTSAA